MRAKARDKTFPILLILAGLLLLGYGLFYHARSVAIPEPNGKRTDRVSEYRLVREVTIGGLERTGSGNLRRTYGGGSGPALCPT